MLANIALPSFFPHSLATLLGMVIIAAIEGWFLMRALNLKFSAAYRLSLYANWWSTIVGIPVAWVYWMLGLVPLTIGFGSLGGKLPGYLESTILMSMITGGMPETEWSNVGSSAAWILKLIPFWMGSVWIERKAIQKRLPEVSASKISTAVIRGNLASYTLFLMLGIVALVASLKELPERKIRYREITEKRMIEWEARKKDVETSGSNKTDEE